MQKFPTALPASERKVVRKWQFAVVAFYGSLLSFMVLMAFLSKQDVHVAKSEIPQRIQGK